MSGLSALVGGRGPRRVRTVLPAGAAALAAGGLALAQPAGAVPSPPGPPSPASTIVGGPLLTGSRVLVHRTAGVPAPPTVAADGWLVADLDSGDVLAAKAPHARFGPASTLKVLTALVLIPRLAPASLVLARMDDVNIQGSRVGVVPGHKYTVDQLMLGTLMVSGNDAARVLARAVGGEHAAVELMNAEAAHLQARDTHAGTVTGLDAPGQTSSAYDEALIGRAAFALPSFRRYVGTRREEFVGQGVRGFEIDTHNPLLLHGYPGTLGVKNGYTTQAMASFIGVARHGNRTIIITMIHAAPDFKAAAEALLTWGFAADGATRPIGTLVDPVQPASAPGPAAVTGTTATATTAAAHHRSWLRSRSGPQWAAAGALAAMVTLLLLRRRQVRRRRRNRYRTPYGRPGGRKLTLPRP